MLPVETRGKDLADVAGPEGDDDADDVTSSIELSDRVGNSVLLRRESAHNDEHFEEGEDEGLKMDDEDEVML